MNTLYETMKKRWFCYGKFRATIVTYSIGG